MSQLRFIRQVIYTLKTRYGTPVRLMRRLTSTVNRETGVKEVTYRSVYVRKAIPLPNTQKREFFYDLTFIASNKNFTYGGLVGTHARDIILDPRDLAGFIPDLGDWFVYDGKRYEISGVATFEERSGYVIQGRQSDGEEVEAVIPVSASNALGVTDNAEADQS